MAKKIRAVVKLQIEAGKATPAPPVGPALGQHGVNIMGFVKEYNAQTASQVGSIVPVHITVYEDRSFSFVTKTSPASDMIRKAIKIDKGSSLTPREKVGTISKSLIREIASVKMEDLNAADIEAAERIIEGTARSMGVDIEG